MHRLIAGFVCALLSGAALAITVVPTSYSMPNGAYGAVSYWDDTYNGSGCITCSGAALSGGLGQLTDSVSPTVSWSTNYYPWVGWASSPTLTFFFNGTVAIDTVTFHFDDSGVPSGVAPPTSVVINGQTFAVTDPVTNTPYDFTVSGLTFTGSSMTISLNRKTSWVMLGEVSFLSTVPEVPTWVLMALGLAGLVSLQRAGRHAGSARAFQA